jgi:uncharacterized protein (TIGR02996 family)
MHCGHDVHGNVRVWKRGEVVDTQSDLMSLNPPPPHLPKFSVDSLQEAQFRKAILAEPSDAVLKLVFADWLEEQGRGAEAQYFRTCK